MQSKEQPEQKSLEISVSDFNDLLQEKEEFKKTIDALQELKKTDESKKAVEEIEEIEDEIIFGRKRTVLFTRTLLGFAIAIALSCLNHLRIFIF
jgi:hypothetical protein